MNETDDIKLLLLFKVVKVSIMHEGTGSAIKRAQHYNSTSLFQMSKYFSNILYSSLLKKIQSPIKQKSRLLLRENGFGCLRAL